MKPAQGNRPFPTPSRRKREVDRRLESLHFKGGSWLRRQNPSRICSRNGLALSASSNGMAERSEKTAERRPKRAKGRQLDSPHIYGVPWPGRKSSENQESPPAQNHSIFTVSRDHVEKCRKVLERTFAQHLKSRGCFEEARQADSLHIYGVS